VRLGHIRNLAHRLAAASALRPGTSEDGAVEILFLLTSFEAYDYLRSGARLSTEATAGTLTQVAERSLLA
jgi:hypothetical protein